MLKWCNYNYENSMLKTAVLNNFKKLRKNLLVFDRRAFMEYLRIKIKYVKFLFY